MSAHGKEERRDCGDGLSQCMVRKETLRAIFSTVTNCVGSTLKYKIDERCSTITCGRERSLPPYIEKAVHLTANSVSGECGTLKCSDVKDTMLVPFAYMKLLFDRGGEKSSMYHLVFGIGVNRVSSVEEVLPPCRGYAAKTSTRKPARNVLDYLIVIMTRL